MTGYTTRLEALFSLKIKENTRKHIHSSDTDKLNHLKPMQGATAKSTSPGLSDMTF